MSDGHNVTPPPVDKPGAESAGVAKAADFMTRVQLGNLLEEAQAIGDAIEVARDKAQAVAHELVELRGRTTVLAAKIAKVRG